MPAPGKRDNFCMDKGIEILAGWSTLIVIRAVEHAVIRKKRRGIRKLEI